MNRKKPSIPPQQAAEQILNPDDPLSVRSWVNSVIPPTPAYNRHALRHMMREIVRDIPEITDPQSQYFRLAFLDYQMQFVAQFAHSVPISDTFIINRSRLLVLQYLKILHRGVPISFEPTNSEFEQLSAAAGYPSYVWTDRRRRPLEKARGIALFQFAGESGVDSRFVPSKASSESRNEIRENAQMIEELSRNIRLGTIPESCGQRVPIRLVMHLTKPTAASFNWANSRLSGSAKPRQMHDPYHYLQGHAPKSFQPISSIDRRTRHALREGAMTFAAWPMLDLWGLSDFNLANEADRFFSLFSLGLHSNGSQMPAVSGAGVRRVGTANCSAAGPSEARIEETTAAPNPSALTQLPAVLSQSGPAIKPAPPAAEHGGIDGEQANMRAQPRYDANSYTLYGFGKTQAFSERQGQVVAVLFEQWQHDRSVGIHEKSIFKKIGSSRLLVGDFRAVTL